MPECIVPAKASPEASMVLETAATTVMAGVLGTLPDDEVMLSKRSLHSRVMVAARKWRRSRVVPLRVGLMSTRIKP